MIEAVSLCSGSKGNSLYVNASGLKILFDVGKSFNYLKKELKKIKVPISEIDYIFITHNHIDHISALDLTLKNSKAILCIPEVFQELFPEVEKNITFNKKINLDDILVTSVSGSHDVMYSFNYTLEFNDKKLSYITDTGYIHNKNFSHFKNSDIFFIESNHDIEMLKNGPYPEFLQNRVLSDEGHLSNHQTGFYLSKLIGKKTKEVILTHLSEKNNTEKKALETVESVLKENGVDFNSLSCARQNESSRRYVI